MSVCWDGQEPKLVNTNNILRGHSGSGVHRTLCEARTYNCKIIIWLSCSLNRTTGLPHKATSLTCPQTGAYKDLYPWLSWLSPLPWPLANISSPEPLLLWRCPSVNSNHILSSLFGSDLTVSHWWYKVKRVVTSWSADISMWGTLPG